MRIATLAPTACTMIGSSNIPAAAQTASLDDCRANAIGQGLSGEAQNKAISECFGVPARGPQPRCRGEAVDQYMAQSGAAAEESAKYSDCRSRTVARGLAGEARGEFIDSCLGD